MAERLHFKQVDIDDLNYDQFGRRVLSDDKAELVPEAEANLVSSLCADGMHRPCLDLDAPHTYVPSSTPGHGHLFFDVPMEWGTYASLLNKLAEAGLVDKRWVKHSLRRRQTFLRKPGVKKPQAPPAVDQQPCLPPRKRGPLALPPISDDEVAA